MSRDLQRLLRPKSIAVIGGGAWCRQVIRQLHLIGYPGPIWPVHPRAVSVERLTAYTSVPELPGVPDAVFVGVNRHATIGTVAALSAMGAGGAVCFASGFSESVAEDAGAADLQAQLVAAADKMPVLGPNCYGFINALDGALLWPDQHGCTQVDKGVAILTQSSNIAINLTMQKRGLPIAYTVTCGNMAQTRQADIAMALLDDPRVTAIGLHIEGFGDTGVWHDLAQKAWEKGVPLVALKVGVSDQARHATVSHTASLAGSDAGAAALLRRLGIARVHDLPTFLETLKLLHANGPLDNKALSSISCSGGEASLAADTAHGSDLVFPELTKAQKQALTRALGPMVALSNPLDYHTYIWTDADKMTAAWAPMAADHIGLTLIIVDYPHTDASDWTCATKAALSVRQMCQRPVAVVATLPELMPPEIAAELMAGGVTPICGLTEAIGAARAASSITKPDPNKPLLAGADRRGETLSEADAKSHLANFGVIVPNGIVAHTPKAAGEAAESLTAPLVLKGQGIAHKTESNAVQIGLAVKAVQTAAEQMPATTFLVEEMVQGAVAELLIGVQRDPAHGFVLTLGAGGVMTELWQDTVSLLLPVSESDVKSALTRLKTYPLLTGFRGKSGADIAAIVGAVMGLQACVIAYADRIDEVEINPLICTANAAFAVDALMVLSLERKLT
ncbi:MAG: acetate--CoA ligase family protein [Sulfitobacter sp.]